MRALAQAVQPKAKTPRTRVRGPRFEIGGGLAEAHDAPLQNYEKFIPKKIRKFRKFAGYQDEKFSRWPKSSWTLTSNNSGQDRKIGCIKISLKDSLRFQMIDDSNQEMWNLKFSWKDSKKITKLSQKSLRVPRVFI